MLGSVPTTDIFSLAVLLIHLMYSNCLKLLGYKNKINIRPAFCDHGIMLEEGL